MRRARCCRRTSSSLVLAIDLIILRKERAFRFGVAASPTDSRKRLCEEPVYSTEELLKLRLRDPCCGSFYTKRLIGKDLKQAWKEQTMDLNTRLAYS